jgi:hypothetical protein
VSTKKAGKPAKDDLRAEYRLKDLGAGVRGKYFRRATSASNIVVLDPDVARSFPTAQAVNEALRMLAQVAKKTSRRKQRDARVGAA